MIWRKTCTFCITHGKCLKKKVLIYLCQILQITTQNIEELNNSFQRDITATRKVSQEAYEIFSVFSKHLSGTEVI